MNDKLKKLISTEYGIEILQMTDAPRQFVAETYVITTKAKRYFAKIVTKPLFIPHMIESLPVVSMLHKAGLERLGYPIQTTKGKLHVFCDGTLIVLFNYIDAKQ